MVKRIIRIRSQQCERNARSDKYGDDDDKRYDAPFTHFAEREKSRRKESQSESLRKIGTIILRYSRIDQLAILSERSMMAAALMVAVPSLLVAVAVWCGGQPKLNEL